MNSVIPFRLDEGLLLEDSGVLLPWSASVETLLDLAGGFQSRWGEVSWAEKTVLGGLKGNVRYVSRRGEYEITPVFKDATQEAAAYDICTAHLTKHVGAPHEVRKDKSRFVPDLYYPISVWTFADDVVIALRTYEGDRAALVPYCDLSIARKKKQ